MGKLELEKCRELVKSIVDEYGEEHVYERPAHPGMCVYQHDGKPSCIVGHVLHRSGWTIDELSFLDYRGKEYVTGTNAYELHLRGDVTLEAAGYLEALQRAQDDGHTWGAAIQIAEGEVSAK